MATMPRQWLLVSVHNRMRTLRLFNNAAIRLHPQLEEAQLSKAPINQWLSLFVVAVFILLPPRLLSICIMMFIINYCLLLSLCVCVCLKKVLLFGVKGILIDCKVLSSYRSNGCASSGESTKEAYPQLNQPRTRQTAEMLLSQHPLRWLLQQQQQHKRQHLLLLLEPPIFILSNFIH